jgi:hypothetical protein
MSLKPSIVRDVAADAVSMKAAIGPKLGSQFIANPRVVRYSFVLKFPDGVVSGRAIAHALKKLPSRRGPTLLAGYDFTAEARRIAEAEACDLACAAEFGWTDTGYAIRRLR